MRRQDLTLRKEFRGQASMQQWLSAAPITLTAAASTGLVAVSVPVSVSQIPNFTSRFAAFQEARIVGCRAKVLCFSSTHQGILSHWFESGLDLTPPTLANTEDQIVKRFNFSDITKPHVLHYTPSDPLELQWAPLSSTATIAGNYNIFTNSANYGSTPSGSVSPTPSSALLQVDFLVQLRGLI